MMKFNRIKGEDRPHNILRLPKLGHIRLGIKKVSQKSGKEYPTETDYFVCPPEIQAKYGEQPKELPVMIPVENEEMFFMQFYACYGSNQKMKCWGNGENAERTTEEGKQQLECPHPEKCEYAGKNGCRARTIIQLVIPDINMGGIYQLSTGSINSDIDIRSGIEMAKHLFGRISWVPMVIKREEKKIPDPTTGNMQTHWTVKLIPHANVEQVNAIRENNKRILEHQKQFALPEPIVEGELEDTPIEYVDDEDVVDSETLESESQDKKGSTDKPQNDTQNEQPEQPESTVTEQPEQKSEQKNDAQNVSYDERIQKAVSLEELARVWSEVQKNAMSFTKKQTISIGRMKNNKKKKLVEGAIKQLKEAKTLEELEKIFIATEPYTTGVDKTDTVRARDVRATTLKKNA